MKITLLAGLFCITALLYASAGFGGGSSYTALLIISGTDYHLVPIIALACNILVVSGNTVRYGREGLIAWRRIWPLICLSIPAAWIGGRIDVPQHIFIGLLAAALFIAGIRLLVSRQDNLAITQPRDTPIWLSAIMGGAIGFYSGLVGIGGGIFLAPILHFLRWGSAKHIAATCSLFILVNSISGIGGQFTKLNNLSLASDAAAFWPLLPAVFIGGFIGNHLGVFKISELWLKRITGFLILAVAIRLTLRWLSLIA